MIIFPTEKAEIFMDYLFILARFSVRLPLFFDDLKTIFWFSEVKFAIYLTKIKSEKSTVVFNSPENNKPCRHKLVSDKQIKFKEFCVS